MVWLFHCLYLLLKLHCISLLLCSFYMGDTVSSHGTQDFPIKFEEKELRERLSPEQYGVTQNRATERAFTGIYWDNDKEGTYRCVVCDQQLFSSSKKFNSGSGWPSFYEVLKQGAVKEVVDTSLGMKRTEIVCSKCGAHLGHLFDDGPQPTGKRFCMNSASLHFQDKESVTNTGTSKQDL